MSPIITLFCEGKTGSLDYRIIQLLSTSGSAYIEPIGGKTTFKAYIQGFFSANKVTRPEFARAFRDRDFDYPVPDAPALTEDGRFLVAYRTTIENYLLHPQTLFDYVHQEKKEKQVREKLNNIAATENLFREVCHELKFYTAARWAHGTAKRNEPDKYAFQSNWPYRSGRLPERMEDADCRALLSGFVEKLKQKADALSFAAFESHYAAFVQRFDAQFLDDIPLCLVWFNAKDIAAMIHKKLGGNSFFQGGQEGDYYDFAIRNTFEQSLRNGEFPDLSQLKNILNGSVSIKPVPFQ